jgi:hypothetical protein
MAAWYQDFAYEHDLMGNLYSQTENSNRKPEDNDLDEMLETMEDRVSHHHNFFSY